MSPLLVCAHQDGYMIIRPCSNTTYWNSLWTLFEQKQTLNDVIFLHIVNVVHFKMKRITCFKTVGWVNIENRSVCVCEWLYLGICFVALSAFVFFKKSLLFVIWLLFFCIYLFYFCIYTLLCGQSLTTLDGDTHWCKLIAKVQQSLYQCCQTIHFVKSDKSWFEILVNCD